jgi:hypothetical protein
VTAVAATLEAMTEVLNTPALTFAGVKLVRCEPLPKKAEALTEETEVM